TDILALVSVVVPDQRLEGRPVTNDDLAFRPSELLYITGDMIARLTSIINVTEPHANRYNVGLVPLSATWGRPGDGSGFDRFLCVNGRPVTVWMVGIVTSTWLTPPEGTRVSIGVRLLCQRDMDAAKYFQFKMSNPAGDATYAGLTTFAKRYLPSRGEDVSFTEVFDATDRLAAWSNMSKIDPARVQKTDVVVVECYVKRFKTTTQRYNWTQWGVGFELLRIAHLLSGPGPVEIVPEDSHVNL
ncbi:hypothetical protein FKP32DRAFT_1569061, partial [Trametes sanguinea]